MGFPSAAGLLPGLELSPARFLAAILGPPRNRFVIFVCVLGVLGVLGLLNQGRYNTRIQPMPQTQKTRREVLENFVATNPNDPFALYGLAVECAKLGDTQAATEHFRKLLGSHPGYVAGYFQFGQLQARLGRISEAKRTLSAGIVAAQKAGDFHARDEMQAALSALS